MVVTGKRNEFTVGDFLSKIADNYLEIRINEYKNDVHTGRRWIIPRHGKLTTEIPDDVLEAKISMIVLYFDGMSIEIDGN